MIILKNDNCLNVIKKIESNKKIVIVTDPPFNVGYHYDTYSDRMDEKEYYAMLKEIFADRAFVIIHYPESIYRLCVEMNQVPQKVVSWVYNSNTAKQHRDIAFFGIKPNFNLVKQPYKNPTDKRIRERMARGIEGGAVVRLVGSKPSEECVKG